MDEVVSGTRVGAKCGRWNPTAEQVKVLTDLFTSGLRTPTTEQIQMISSHLSSFGKIESKNVFYWFQNHKARERHHKKRRRGGGGGGGGDLCTSTIKPDRIKEARSCAKVAADQQEVIWERREREIETLELFPLSSYNLGMDRWSTVRNECREMPLFNAADKDPPLDLRLSFL